MAFETIQQLFLFTEGTYALRGYSNIAMWKHVHHCFVVIKNHWAELVVQKSVLFSLLVDSPEVGNKDMSTEGEIAVEAEKKEVVAQAEVEKKAEGISIVSNDNG